MAIDEGDDEVADDEAGATGGDPREGDACHGSETEDGTDMDKVLCEEVDAAE